jgi:hypothetical protein
MVEQPCTIEQLKHEADECFGGSLMKLLMYLEKRHTERNPSIQKYAKHFAADIKLLGTYYKNKNATKKRHG